MHASNADVTGTLAVCRHWAFCTLLYSLVDSTPLRRRQDSLAMYLLQGAINYISQTASKVSRNDCSAEDED